MMKKWKRALSLTLALALSLVLAVPAFAAGTTQTVTDEVNGTVITTDGFLRVETRRYLVDGRPFTLTVHVVEDNSTVTIEAMEGRRYATEAEDEAFWEGKLDLDPEIFAYVGCGGYGWLSDEDGLGGFGGPPRLMAEPMSYTITPAASKQDIKLEYVNGICFLCESDFAKLPSFEGRPIAAGWAQDTLDNAYDAGLFPSQFNPFRENCFRSITRAEFADAAVNLYCALRGIELWEIDPGSDHPFTDVVYGVDAYSSTVAYAYNLGIVNGTGATTFSPDATLTREQAAVMLARVYSKVYGGIPTVTATGFGDDGAVSSWAKSGVAFMADKGIVNGVGGNRFAPRNTLSVQEAVVMAQRMLENLK